MAGRFTGYGGGFEESVSAMASTMSSRCRRIIRIDLADDWGDISESVVQFIDRANKLLSEIPEEWRDAVRIEFDSGEYSYLKIFYNRPETDAEMESRLTRT